MYNDFTELYHHGIKGQKWGVRRYQNADGSLTDAGQKRFGNGQGKLNERGRDKYFYGRNLVSQGRYKKETEKIKKNLGKAALGAGAAGLLFFGTRKLADDWVTKSTGLGELGLKSKTPVMQHAKNLLVNALNGNAASALALSGTIAGSVTAAKSGHAAIEAYSKKHDMDFYKGYSHHLEQTKKHPGTKRI